MTRNPTGEQYRISHGPYVAVVTEVGATLRSFCVEEREWLWSFGEDKPPIDSQGRQLLPWPNRIRDGRYTLDGVAYQLPISEVPRNTALHGLNEGFTWELITHTERLVVQRHTFHPETGWPGTVTVTLSHSVNYDGLLVRVHATNDGSAPLPYGYGVHPYFAIDTVDDVHLELPFTSELRVDEDRLLPEELSAVSPGMDFRAPRRIGTTWFDTAFTDPTTPQWTTRVVSASHTVEVWADQSLPWVQIFTKPDRSAVAVEPMTCGPDAFNEGPTHDGLIILSPGESHVASWGLRAG